MAAFTGDNYLTSTSTTLTITSSTASNSPYGYNYAPQGQSSNRISEEWEKAQAEKERQWLEARAKEAKKEHRERSMDVPYQHKFGNGVGHKAPLRCRGRPREDRRRPLGGN